MRVRPSVFREFGLDRHTSYRALHALEVAGLVSVVRRRGVAPLVTLLVQRALLPAALGSFIYPIFGVARPPWVLPFMSTAAHNTAHNDAARLLYDRKAAARQLSISVRSLDYLIVQGKVNIRRIGSRVLIQHEELVRLASRDHDIAA